jgi:hypothetical protein
MFSGNIPGGGERPVHVFTTIAVADNTAAATVWEVARIPSNARIMPGSWIATDDLETGSDTPTLDVGFAAVNGNITSDADALQAGITAATAGVTPLIANTSHQLWGKQAWEYVNGQTSDPGGFLDLTVSLLDHNATEAGDVSVYLVYQVD